MDQRTLMDKRRRDGWPSSKAYKGSGGRKGSVKRSQRPCKRKTQISTATQSSDSA